MKTYGSSFAPYQRPITKPVDGSVRIAVAGDEIASSAFSCDVTTGLVTFASGHIPAAGAAYHRRLPVRCAGAFRYRLSRSRSVGLCGRRDPENSAGGDQDMRAIPAALQARLDSGVTTLAQVWKLTRRDGVVAGFTDHDCDLVIGGVTYRAGTGLAASEATSRFDLSVDGGDIAGALDDDILTDADLAAGRYDAAQVETWLVDWSDTSLRVLTARGTLGEVKREGPHSSPNCAGLRRLLSQESGRLYTARAAPISAMANAASISQAGGGTGAVEALEGVSMFSASGLVPSQMICSPRGV
jgi:hypothetical protein